MTGVQTCALPIWNQYIRYPSKNIITVRLPILRKNAPLSSSLFLEKLSALPTANRNDGKTRSVGVKPNQAAWSSGAHCTAPEPGAFTMIIKHMVIPLKISSVVNLLLDSVMFCIFLLFFFIPIVCHFERGTRRNLMRYYRAIITPYKISLFIRNDNLFLVSLFNFPLKGINHPARLFLQPEAYAIRSLTILVINYYLVNTGF